MSNLAIREKKVMNAFELEAVKEQLSSLLDANPKKMEAFKTRVLNMSLSYGLKDCSPESVISCGIQALTVDLPLQSGQGYIVNYGGQAQFDCGYKGWQVLAKRAGYSVQADVVYRCDEFSQNGFGFNREMVFNPSFAERQGHNDSWAKDNLVGVIVSILEEETKQETHAFVDAGMIQKITSISPSQKSEKGKKFSPHENWAEQMFCAKAIKQVLSKFAIDLTEATKDIHTAIEYVNNTESAQQQAANKPSEYPKERFDENFPKWKKLVEDSKKTALSIITQLSNSYTLSPNQMEEVMKLRNFEPIDGECAEEAQHAQ